MTDRSADRLPPALLAEIGALAAARVFAKNAVIVSEGDDSGSVYVLLSGRVKVFLSDDQGREVELNRLGPGEYFGEVTLDGGPRSASVVALEETRCAVLRSADLLGLIERQPGLALHMLRRLARRVRALSENVRSLALMDVYGRVARLLLELAEEKDGRLVIAEPLTHREIASRVGASREMVSRIFSDLAEGGYVSKEDGRLVVVRKPPPRW